MKKLLGLLVVITMAWPTAASADVLKNVDLIGEIQTIASDVRHNDTGLYDSGTNTRVLAGLSAELVEDVRANLMFEYVTAWNGNTSGESVDHYWQNVRLTEANVVLSNLFDCFEATVGRQFYGEDGSAVIYFGPTHYNAELGSLATNSIDALKVAYSDDFKAFTLIAGKVDYVNPFTTPALTYDLTMIGADLKLNLTETLTAQIYGYNFHVANTSEDVGFYGAKATFAPEALTASVEYARNFDGHRPLKESHNNGYMVKADVALDLEAFTPRATFLYGHENFFAFGNYQPGLLVGQVVDVFEYTTGNGVRMFNVGVDFKPWEKWTIAVDGYSFQGRSAHHAATLEADLTAKYAHNEYVELFAGVGYAKYSAEVGSGDNTKGQIGMLINF